MILATHQMGFAYHIADRVAFLDAGTILEIGRAKDVLTNPQEPRTRQFLERVLAAAPMTATLAGDDMKAAPPGLRSVAGVDCD